MCGPAGRYYEETPPTQQPYNAAYYIRYSNSVSFAL
jgi:hypothetical protein